MELLQIEDSVLITFGMARTESHVAINARPVLVMVVGSIAD